MVWAEREAAGGEAAGGDARPAEPEPTPSMGSWRYFEADAGAGA